MFAVGFIITAYTSIKADSAAWKLQLMSAREREEYIAAERARLKLEGENILTEQKASAKRALTFAGMSLGIALMILGLWGK